MESFSQLVPLLLAVMLFPLVIWVPGFVLGEMSGWLGWGLQKRVQRVAASLLFSLALCPILVYLTARMAGFRGVWVVFGVIWALALWRWAKEPGALWAAVREIGRDHWRGACVLSLWVLGCSLEVIDIVLPGDVWRNLNAMDAVAHISFTDSITRTGIPPANPFAFPGQAVPLFYYYFWYMMCSLVDQLGGTWVNARAAVQAGTIYVGLGLAALVAMFVWLVTEGVESGRKLRLGVAWTLLAVTGLDVIPWTFLHLLKHYLQLGAGGGQSLEHWNEQVTAWMGGVLMSPHHPAALVMSFTMILTLVHLVRGQGTAVQQAVAVAVGGIGMASAAGTSLYVTFALGAGLALWSVWMLVRGQRRPVGLLVAAGVLALGLYAPFALELKASSNQPGGLPLQLTVRAFEITDYWLPSIIKPLKQWPAARYGLRLLFLPVNYFFEFGYFLVAALLYWRWRRAQARVLDAVEGLLVALAAGSFLVCTFLASTFRWNDLGWRAFLVAQFILLLWAVPLTQSLLYKEPGVPQAWRRGLILLLGIGILGTVTEVINFRLTTDGPRGPASVARREAYLWIARNTPTEAIVAFNPDINLEYFSGLYGNRQAVSAGRAYGTFFALGKPGEIALEESLAFFQGRYGEAERQAFLDRYQVGVIVVLAGDPLWEDRTSWVWSQKHAYGNDLVRVFLR